MQYREMGKTGLKVSALGFGMMRLPIHEDGSINEEVAISMVRHAIDEGVNYIDTAWPYHSGMSEVLVGKALQDGYREKVYLATKYPVFMVKEEAKFDQILNKQLEKLQTDHIDFYLLHGIGRNTIQKIKDFHMLEHAKQALEDGRIRHLGFSFHDDFEAFKECVALSDLFEFCQLQYNYIDTFNQAGTAGVEYAAEKGLGVIIMEPLRGGKLADPPENVRKVLSDAKEPVEWALDFLWNRPEISLLLSGMSTPEQVEGNLLYADRSSVGMLKEEDIKMLEKAKEVYDHNAFVPCTKCRYCMPCPGGLNIPGIFEIYNKSALDRIQQVKAQYAELEVKADECLNCKYCESQCPQHIKISEIMPTIAEVLG